MMEPKIRFKGFEGEWIVNALDDLSDSICSGKDVAHIGKYPLYGSTGIIGSTDKPSHNGNMLLVARVGANAGKLQHINEECGISDNTLIIKSNGKISDEYLFYYLKHFNLNRLVYGSGQPLITAGMLKSISVLYGNKEERCKIATFFTSLDHQISAAEKQLGSLKQVKAASLQAMFPQEGETVPKLRFKGCEGEWKKVKLGELISINRGLTYSPSNISTTGVRVLRSSNIDEDSFVLSDTDVFVLPECVNIEFAHEGDILITAANGSPRLVGKHAIIRSSNTPCVAGGFMLFASGNENEFVNALMGAGWYSKLLKVCVAGGNGSIGNLNKSDLEDAEVLIPIEKKERNHIATFFTTLDRQITSQSEKISKLKQIKAACLDQMFV